MSDFLNSHNGSALTHNMKESFETRPSNQHSESGGPTISSPGIAQHKDPIGINEKKGMSAQTIALIIGGPLLALFVMVGIFNYFKHGSVLGSDSYA